MTNVKIASELRRIAKEIVAMDFPTQSAFDKYLKEHPKADKANHKVVKNNPSSKPSITKVKAPYVPAKSFPSYKEMDAYLESHPNEKCEVVDPDTSVINPPRDESSGDVGVEQADLARNKAIGNNEDKDGDKNSIPRFLMERKETLSKKPFSGRDEYSKKLIKGMIDKVSKNKKRTKIIKDGSEMVGEGFLLPDGTGIEFKDEGGHAEFLDPIVMGIGEDHPKISLTTGIRDSIEVATYSGIIRIPNRRCYEIGRKPTEEQMKMILKSLLNQSKWEKRLDIGDPDGNVIIDVSEEGKTANIKEEIKVGDVASVEEIMDRIANFYKGEGYVSPLRQFRQSSNDLLRLAKMLTKSDLSKHKKTVDLEAPKVDVAEFFKPVRLPHNPNVAKPAEEAKPKP